MSYCTLDRTTRDITKPLCIFYKKAYFIDILFILFINIDMLIANKLLPLSVAGSYGALVVFPKNLRIMSTALDSIWRPLILAEYSQSDFKNMDRLVLFSMKLSGVVLPIIVGLIAGLAKPFLNLWLGPDFEQMALPMSFMVLPLATNLIVSPFYNIEVSFDKLKIPALAGIGIAIFNLLLMSWLTGYLGVIGLVISAAVSLSSRTSRPD